MRLPMMGFSFAEVLGFDAALGGAVYPFEGKDVEAEERCNSGNRDDGIVE